MSIGEEITAIISYVILGISAVFGMYNTFMYLYLSGERSPVPLMLNGLLEYLKGALFGVVILEATLVVLAIGFALWERRK